MKSSFIPSFFAIMALAGGMSGAAVAGTVAVSPLVGKGGVDSLQILNITSLIASEVDFLSQYDGVKQLPAMPTGMNSACLGSPACLAGVLRISACEALIAGSVANNGTEFDLTLLLYQNGGITRKNTWKIANDPTQVADRMGGLVSELVTGKSTTASRESDQDLGGLETLGSNDALDGDDAFTFDDEPVSRRIATPATGARTLVDEPSDDDDAALEEEEAARAAAAAAEKAAAAEAARKAAAAETARLKAAEDARIKREADARRQAEEQARQAAAAEAARRAAAEEAARKKAEAAKRATAAPVPASASSDDDDDIDFAPVSSDDMDIEFASAAGLISVEPAEPATTPSRSTSTRSTSTSSRTPTTSSSKTPLPSTSSASASRTTSTSSSSTRLPVIRTDDEDLSAESLFADDEDDFSTSSRKAAPSLASELDEEDARAASSRSSSSRSSYSPEDDFDESSSRSSRSSGTDFEGSIHGGDNDRKSALSLRLGTSGYYNMLFITYGGELAFKVGDAGRLAVGIEAFSANRHFPPKQCPEKENMTDCYRWNSILPFYFGARYQPSEGVFQPHVGGELTLTPYTAEFDIAVGLRTRGGFDVALSDAFGLNLDLILGYMYGGKFETVQDGVKNGGLTWQIAAGTFIAF